MLRVVESLVPENGSVFVYPLNTRVLIVGNKRTKPDLVGQEGVVIRTRGLGGWHWLRLQSGDTVRVQRNALCVIGQKEYSKAHMFYGQGRWNRDNRFSPGTSSEEDKQTENALHTADFTLSEETLEEMMPEDTYSTRASGRINLHKLSYETLQRYRKAYRLRVAANAHRSLLLRHVWGHFESMDVDECSVLSLMTCKRSKHYEASSDDI